MYKPYFSAHSLALTSFIKTKGSVSGSVPKIIETGYLNSSARKNYFSVDQKHAQGDKCVLKRF